MKSFIMSLMVFLAAFTCLASETSLAGIYSVPQNGVLIEFVKVEKQADSFAVWRKRNGEWSSPIKVNPVSKELFQKLTRGAPMVDFTGLGNSSIAVLQVPKGWRFGERFETKTEYVLMTIAGPIDLHKK